MGKILPLIFLGIGVFLLTQVALPPLAFKVWEISTNSELTLADPVSGSVLGISVENVNNFPTFISTNPANIPYTSFSLSISSIKLNNIKVKVSSNTFEDALAQLPGSALPGERGNVFISGHSSLPQFFSPTNFQAIFSNLPNIKKGDLIRLVALGQEYQYQVDSLKVVSPTDVSVINPPDQTGRYLSLMTCVPPGFNTKRLIVLAKLK